MTEQPRIVKCPKCRQLLTEYSHYTIYKCGGCGTTLEAKKRRKEAANTGSGKPETDANSRKVVNHVSEDKKRSSEEEAARPQENVLRTKTTSSSSEECTSEGHDGSSQIENGECDNKQSILLQENGESPRRTSSSSGECSLAGDSGINQNGNGECIEETEMPNRTNSSSGNCSLNINGVRDESEHRECDEKQLALPQPNVPREESTCSSSGEHPLDANENGDLNEKQLVLPLEKVQVSKSTSSSSRECDEKQLPLPQQNVCPQEKVQITKSTSSSSRECDEKRLALPQHNVPREESTSSSSGEHPLRVNENGDLNVKELVFLQEKVQMRKSTSSSSGEYSLHSNDSKDQIRNEESNGKKLVLPNGSKATSFSSASLDENDYEEQDSNGACNIEQLDLPHENIQITEPTSFPAGECSLDEIVGRDQNETGEFNVAFSLSDEEMEKEVDIIKLSHKSFKQHEASNNGYHTELKETKIESSSVPMAGENSAEEIIDKHLQDSRAARSNDRILALKEAKEQLSGGSDGVDANNDKSTQVVAEVGVTRFDDTAKSLTDYHSALGEASTSGNSLPSHNDQVKQVLDPKSYTFDESEVLNHSSELSGELGKLPKSPATRSCHTYDGSVSSLDEMDKQFPDQHFRPFENNSDAANFLKGKHRKGKGPINSMNIPPDLPRGRNHVVKDSIRSQYEPQETMRQDRTVHHRMRAGTEHYPPRIPYHRSGSQSSYVSDMPSTQGPDEEHYFSSSSFLSREGSDQEKMDLLRMIYKLQNELKRTNSLKGDTTERLFPGDSYKGNRVSTSHSHDFHEGRRFSHDISDPWSDAEYYHGPMNWRQRSKRSIIPFSAEASSSTHHVDDSCFHCQHQEWRYSAELPPRALCQHEELCKYHPVHNNCCHPPRSYPFRAPRYVSSRHQLYGQETKSYDPRHRAHEMRMYSREKQIMSKKHFRPVAGGAPFITCRNCFKLLHLPADFLLFKRVCHQLKCGHCSEILKFSLQNKSHIVSYDPSQHGSLNEVNKRSSQLASSASLVVPVSFSDDYGNYVSKSYSSAGDPVSLTSFRPLHGSVHDTNDSSGAFEEINGNVPRHAHTNKAPVGTRESKKTSSNISGSGRSSSETETVLAPRSSPLHQLMGYSSPSQVIRGIEVFDKGNELMKNEQDHI